MNMRAFGLFSVPVLAILVLDVAMAQDQPAQDQPAQDQPALVQVDEVRTEPLDPDARRTWADRHQTARSGRCQGWRAGGGGDG